MTLAETVCTVGHVGWGGWWFPLIPLLFFGFWIFLILVVVRPWVWRRRGFGPQAGSGPEAAEAVLAERYARGEIDEREYRARLETLRASR